MPSKFTKPLRLGTVFYFSLLAIVACTEVPTKNPTGGTMAGTSSSTGSTVNGTPTGSSTASGTDTLSGSGSTVMGSSTTGAGGGTVTGEPSTVTSGGGDVSGSTGGASGTTMAGSGSGGATTGPTTGTGGAPPVNDPTCNSFPFTKFAKLTPEDASVGPLFTQLTNSQKILLLSGEPSPCGAPNYNCDFNATGIATTNPAIPPFKMADGPRGVHLLTNAASTTWAVAMARGASFDDNLEFRVGQIQGVEMRALKLDLSLTPVVNTLRHPQWARAQETYGEDPFHLGRMGAASVLGLQQQVPACPKHFAGNDTDNNRQSVIVAMDEQTLRENYALPFQMLVEQSDPACIMMAYNGVQGAWSSESRHLMIDILRTDWQWGGIALSDWWATKNNGVTSLNNGLDLEMPDNTAFQQITTGSIGSAVTQMRLDQAVRRTINARAKFGQFTPAYLNSPLNMGIVNVQAHKDLARETAEKGAVLLKNAGTLPLGPKAMVVGTGLPAARSIVFLGPDRAIPNAALVSTAGQAGGLGDRGSSKTTPPYAISFIAGVRANAAAMGWTITENAAATGASTAEVAIIPVTMAHEDEGEAFDNGHDRTCLALNCAHPLHWPAQKPGAFINAAKAAAPNTKIIVVLAVGSAIVVEDWWNSADAIVQTFYPGQEGGTAFARLIFGDINFSAKLPFTVATNPAHYPAFNNTGATATTAYLHGYRKFDRENLAPRFFFGHGLSYTKYEYSNLQVLCPSGIAEGGRLNVTVQVKNAGTVAGDEVVQLFVAPPNNPARACVRAGQGATCRPVKELKGYVRVSLMPGETKTVTLNVAGRDLRYWAPTGWVVEKGMHTVLVGPSANPMTLLTAPFTVN